MAAARAVASTDMPVGDDGDASFGDLIAGTGPSTEEEASSSLRDLAVRQAVANLPDRERDVISFASASSATAPPRSRRSASSSA